MNYRLNEPKMFADITEGTAIVINSISCVYYGMNPFGTCVFDNLLQGSSVEEIIAACNGVEGVPEDIEEKIAGFIDTLSGFEMIVPSEGGAPRPAAIDKDVAASDGFIPGCQEYKDVQDLLFADPVHEVDAEEGWKPE